MAGQHHERLPGGQVDKEEMPRGNSQPTLYRNPFLCPAAAACTTKKKLLGVAAAAGYRGVDGHRPELGMASVTGYASTSATQ